MLHGIVITVSLVAHAFAAPADSARSDTDIRLVALRHAAEIQSCYEMHGLKVNPELRGVIEIAVTVAPTGTVEEASVASSALEGAGRSEVEQCITTTVRNWRFERGPFRPETIVYPFNLVKQNALATTSRSTD